MLHEKLDAHSFIRNKLKIKSLFFSKLTLFKVLNINYDVILFL